MRLKSMPVSQIAIRLRISPSTVNRELGILAKQWRAQAAIDTETHRQRELARLEVIEQQAWVEYERSKKDYVKETTERVKGESGGEDFETDPKLVKRETGGRLGDPKYLQIALNAGERRAKMLGLDAPMKVAPTTPDGEQPYEARVKAMPSEELAARIAELLAKAQKRAA